MLLVLLFALAGLVLTDIIMSAEYILPHTEIFQAVYSKKRLAFLLQWSFTKKPLKAENWSLSMCSRDCKLWKLRENWLHAIKIKTFNSSYSFRILTWILNISLMILIILNDDPEHSQTLQLLLSTEILFHQIEFHNFFWVFFCNWNWKLRESRRQTLVLTCARVV